MPKRGMQPDSVRGLANDVLKKVRAMIDLGPYGAGFTPEVKADIRLYCETWLIPPLSRIVKKLEPREKPAP